MKKSLVLVVAALVFYAPLNAQREPRGSAGFLVSLSGANEVPSNNSGTTGHGFFRLDGDTFNYTIGSFLGANPFYPTDVGIYGPAPAGENGRLIFGNLALGISPPLGVAYSGGFRLTADQIAQLRAGLWYVNIKSAQFPHGQIRGQIVLDLGPKADSAKTEPLASGFFGQSLLIVEIGPVFRDAPLPTFPYRTYVTVYDENGKFVSAIVSNPVGQFYARLKPGKYTLLATPPGWRPASPQAQSVRSTGAARFRL